MAVQYEEREQPCTRCAASVSVKIVIPDRPRKAREPQRTVIHDADGTPADARCERPLD
ncbi:MAG: hypothetical protein QOG18_292 [Microbacteriaceae bacterium]|jgi:hypothetical protein|nr:hypothetical protein [Microbacteriaceae bacterium]MDQ1719647.1 hypothetical protein [Pseudonocardiales bacterium]